MWRQGLSRDEQNVFDRYRYRFTSPLEAEEVTVYQAPSISEMVSVISGNQDPDSDSNYVSLSGDVDDDDEDDNDVFEESTYSL